MNTVEIMYCPKCGQGIFVIKNRIDLDFNCINSECNTGLRLILDKDGIIKIKEVKEGSDL